MNVSRFTLLHIAAIMLIVIIALAACAPTPTPVPPPAPTAVPPTSIPPIEALITPEVKVSDQDASKGSVTISSVTAAGAGWIVIHTEKDSTPGPVIGYAPVKAGVNTNVKVDIESAKASPKLFAMLHVDQGTMGIYEFPGADAPTKVVDKIVMTPFKVTLLGATKSTTQVAQNAAFGQFLTDDRGRTLYIFLTDAQKTSACYDACAQNWPPLLIQGNPVAGEGVDASLLGTTQRKDGATQVTYNGWPLYYFAADQKPGDTKGQGVQDVWYVTSPKGEKITAKPVSTASPY